MSLSFILNSPGKPQEVFDFPVRPSSSNMQKNELTTAVEIPHAEYFETHGEGFAKVAIEGTFGLKSRQFNGKSETGTQTFERLEAFINKYWEYGASKNPRISRNSRVEYHDWDRDYHYFAADIDFSIPQGERNKTHLLYSISMTLTRKIKIEPLATPLPDPKAVVAEASTFLKRATENLSNAGQKLSTLSSDALNKLQREVLQPLAKLGEAIIVFEKGVEDIIQMPIKALKALGDGIASTIETFGDIVSSPVTELANTLRQVKRTLNRLEAVPEVFKQTLTTSRRSLANAYEDLISVSDTQAERSDKENGSGRSKSRAARGISEKALSGVESYTVRKGDTLQSIAAQYGSSSEWKAIAILNGITSSSQLDGKILIPVESFAQSAAVRGGIIETGVSLQTTQNRLYGTDIKLVPSNGKLGFAIDRNLPKPDLVLVSGLENLAQAVFKKMMVQQGSLIENPLYGRSQAIGKKAGSGAAQRMKWSLENSIEADSRIASAEVDISAVGNRMDATATFVPIGASNQTGQAIAEGI